MDLEKGYCGKNVLITGGLGFLGSSLAHRLVDLGANVTILDALLPLYGENKFNIAGIEDKVEVVIDDIRNEALVDLLIKKKDFIFNFAAQVSYIDSSKIPFEDLDLNCRGPLIMLESCRNNNKEAKLLFSSSRMALGKIVSNPVKEDHPTDPLSIYGIHKLTGEKYHLAYHRNYGLRTVVMRLTNPYGIRQQVKHNKYSLIGWFIRLAMENKTIRIYGEGDQLRDYIYIDDLVEAFLRSGATDATDGKLINLGYGKSTKFGDMARIVVDTVGQGKIEKVPWPDDYEKLETGDFTLDISNMVNLLKWKPGISIQEGIGKTYDYYKKYHSHYW